MVCILLQKYKQKSYGEKLGKKDFEFWQGYDECA